MSRWPLLCPRHDNGRGIKCYPCPSVSLSVRTYVHTYIRTYICPNDVRSLSQILSIRVLWNLVTLFSTMTSLSSSIMVHIALAFSSYGPLFMKFTIWNDVRSLSRIVLIRILWILVTSFSIMMSFSSSIMVHIAPCFQQLWPFFMIIHRFKWCPFSKSNSFDQNFMKLCHIV